MQISALLAIPWKTLGGVLIAIVILLAMVTIHEFGHYVAGKILGFRINEFAVGFGPAIFKKRSKKTGELFALRIIPLGGYCAFEGEDEYDEPKKNEPQEQPFEELVSYTENTENPENTQNDGGMSLTKEEKEYPTPKGKRFNDQPPWKRIIVLVAGATMNYLLALLLIVIMFSCYGCIHSFVHYVGEETPVVTETALAPRDVVLSVDGKTIYLATDYTTALKDKKQGDVIPVEVLRKNADGVWEEKTLQITLLADCEFKNMNDLASAYAAFGLDPTQYAFASMANNDITGEGFFQTLGRSVVYSGKVGGMVLRTLGELLTGKISITAMGGPITTIGATAQAATSGGLLSTLNIAAFIGVNLAVFNLLPIPALDGCKVIFCIIEWIRKKTVNRKVETIIHLVGILFLFGFAILVDILQWIL